MTNQKAAHLFCCTILLLGLSIPRPGWGETVMDKEHWARERIFNVGGAVVWEASNGTWREFLPLLRESFVLRQNGRFYGGKAAVECGMINMGPLVDAHSHDDNPGTVLYLPIFAFQAGPEFYSRGFYVFPCLTHSLWMVPPISLGFGYNVDIGYRYLLKRLEIDLGLSFGQIEFSSDIHYFKINLGKRLYAGCQKSNSL